MDRLPTRLSSLKCLYIFVAFCCYTMLERQVEGTPVNPCSNYKVMELAKSGRRHPNYKANLDWANICDYDFDEDLWYSFATAVSYRIPEYCVPPKHCGTNSPVWVNGSHPTAASPGPVTVQVCAVHMNGDCCGLWSGNIQVMYCPATSNTEDFYVYKLIHSVHCDSAYCAITRSDVQPPSNSPTTASVVTSEGRTSRTTTTTTTSGKPTTVTTKPTTTTTTTTSTTTSTTTTTPTKVTTTAKSDVKSTVDDTRVQLTTVSSTTHIAASKPDIAANPDVQSNAEVTRMQSTTTIPSHEEKTPNSKSEDNSVDITIIVIVCVVAVLVLFICIIVVHACCSCRRKRSQQQEETTESSGGNENYYYTIRSTTGNGYYEIPYDSNAKAGHRKSTSSAEDKYEHLTNEPRDRDLHYQELK